MEEHVFHFVQYSHLKIKGLSDCKTSKIFDHPLTSPPSPKKGDPTFSAPEQESYCWVFGCSCMVFLSDGLSMSARETIFDRTAPGDRGVTWSSRSKPNSWWESVTCERGMAAFRCSEATEQAHQNAAVGKIRCPRGCSYQDRALIYCKQSVIAAPPCMNHMAWRETALTSWACCSGERSSHIRPCIRDARWDNDPTFLQDPCWACVLIIVQQTSSWLVFVCLSGSFMHCSVCKRLRACLLYRKETVSLR